MRSKMSCRVSVIVPAYDSEEYICDCVESILKQNLEDIEIIIIDDGSKDNTLKICNKYKLLDDRIKVIHQENKGISGARNMGIEYATGEYIAFVDSDDTIEFNMYNELYSLASKSNADFVDSGINIVDLKSSIKNKVINKHKKIYYMIESIC